MNEAASSRETVLIRAFVELADTLVDGYDIIDLLDRLAGYCVELLAADPAGILLADAQRELRVVASTNEQTEWIELLQLQADQGPCVECFRTATPVSVLDLSETTHRWPRFAAALADRASYRSVHALPLRLRGEPIGAGIGVTVPHQTQQIWRAFPPALHQQADLRPGDMLLFGAGGQPAHIEHVRLYLGEGRMVHAPQTGQTVTIAANLWQPGGYWAGRFVGAVRGLPADAPTPSPA